MDKATFEATLQELRRRLPFQPFTVCLTSGVRVEVDDPAAMVVRNGVAAYLDRNKTPYWFDYREVSSIVADS